MWNEEKLKDLEKINNILFKNKEKNKNIIFIYTPPKVGSTALVSSIRISASQKYSVLHIHDEMMLKVFTGFGTVSINDIILYNKRIGKNVFVIDIYRTPIERKISEYFEKITCHHFNNTEENLNGYSLDRIVNRFNKLFPHLSNEDYFQTIYDIIVPPIFDFEKKYLHVKNNDIHFIKLRLCDSSEWNKILSNLLQTEIIIVHDYETEKKKIGELYKKFKSNYKIPNNLLEQIKACPYVAYYLSEGERIKYFDYWEKKVSEEIVPYTKKQYNLYMNICIENQFYNDFQTEHYMDVGCTCRPCSQKRIELFNKAKNGEKITERILHDENISNLQKKIVNNLQEKIKRINNLKPPQIVKKNKPINNIMQNVVGMKRG